MSDVIREATDSAATAGNPAPANATTQANRAQSASPAGPSPAGAPWWAICDHSHSPSGQGGCMLIQFIPCGHFQGTMATRGKRWEDSDCQQCATGIEDAGLPTWESHHSDCIERAGLLSLGAIAHAH